MQQLLALVQQHPELRPLQKFKVALSAAVCAEVAAGDGHILEVAERLAQAGSKQLSSRDIAQLYWATVEGAAAQAVQSSSSQELVVLVNSSAVFCWCCA
jgi:hypothetical protein